MADAINGNGNGNGNGRYKILSGSTLVPIGAAVAIFMGLLGAMNYLDCRFSALQIELSALKDQLRAMDYHNSMQLRLLRSAAMDRWTIQDMKIWEQNLKIENPVLTVPNSTEIARLHVMDLLQKE